MCSSGGSVATEDQALQDSQVALNTTLSNDYNTSFAEQQSTLGNLQARLNYMASNPMGYTPQQLATATTSINENTANAAKQAIGAASAYAAAHGGADVGSGVTGEIAGQVASNAAQSKAQQLSSLSQQSQDLKQQNLWKAISGLSGVGNEYGGSAGTAVSGANGAAESAVNAGSGSLAATQAGWSDFGGIISGIGSLATAAAQFPQA